MGVPEVSIGMPVFNGAKTIARAIESVLNQTYEDVSLLISDNGSTDDTEAICRDLANRYTNIRYVRNEKNVGAALNFNRVFRESDGPYFKWVGHDDVLDPRAIAVAVERLEASRELAVVHWLERMIDDDGNTLRTHEPDQAFNITDRSPAIRFRKMLNWKYLGFAGDPIYGVIRRSALERTHLLPNKLNSNHILLEELALEGGIVSVPEVLATRRYNDVRSTAETMLAWLDPEETHRFPHVRRWWEHVRIGMRGSQSTVEKLKTGATMVRFGLRGEELRGFAWDVVRLLKGVVHRA